MTSDAVATNRQSAAVHTVLGVHTTVDTAKMSPYPATMDRRLLVTVVVIVVVVLVELLLVVVIITVVVVVFVVIVVVVG